MKQELVTIKCGNQEIQGTVCHDEMKLGIEEMCKDYPDRYDLSDGVRKKLGEDWEYEYKNEIVLSDEENPVDDLFYVQFWSTHGELNNQRKSGGDVDNGLFEDLYYNYLLQKYFGLTTLENNELGKIEKDHTELVTSTKIYKMIKKGTKGKTTRNPRKLTDIHNIEWEFCRMNKGLYGRITKTEKKEHGGLGFGGQFGIEWTEMVKISDMESKWTSYEDRQFDYDKMFIVEPKLLQLIQTCRYLGFKDRKITEIHIGRKEDEGMGGYKYRKLSLQQLKDPLFLKEWIENGCGRNDDDTEHKTVKIGRNDPCVCGSGKKFKRCCLN